MNNQDVSQLLLQAMRDLDYRVWIGIAVIMVIGIIEIILCRKGLISSRSTKRMQQAKAKGHVLTARLVSEDFEYFSEGESKRRIRSYIGTYEYEVHGRMKRVTEIFYSTHPPRTLEMYYVSDPEKAFSKMQVKESRMSALLLLIPVAAGVAVTMLLGFRG